MRSKNREIRVFKHPVVGGVPNYLLLAQRHLEKEKPAVGAVMDSTGKVRPPSGPVTLTVPVDLLRMTVGDAVAGQIESVSLTYKAGGVQSIDDIPFEEAEIIYPEMI